MSSYNPRHLDAPLPPFATAKGASSASSLKDDNVSLTVNYLPSKFSRAHSPGVHNRKGKGSGLDEMEPKRGGGREAFRAGEARMAIPGDEDYDGVMPSDGKRKPRMRWNRFKWILFVSNLILTLYSLIGLIFCLLTWFNVWNKSDVVRVGNRSELILSTVAASVAVFTSLVGWSGLLLNNRTFLSIYNLLLWVSFALLVVPGYVSYKRRAFSLESKINAQWSRTLGTEGRLRIQNALQCCGYFSPFVEATVSQMCYSRSGLNGCKGPYLAFEKKALERWYVVVFSLVPLQLLIITAGLLCSNHVTYRFGKGMMPKAYRLSLNSMAVIMESYAQQLAEQFGPDVATEALARSRINLGGFTAGSSPSGSNIALDTIPVRVRFFFPS
ncbi:hypothetical protein M422DRAFT_150887 [Sphaerobolus stellatus SS14]|nr:hypothetical protein M422DRAFT_150887 [Sphaerobolus stellatus SS14]